MTGESLFFTEKRPGVIIYGSHFTSAHRIDRQEVKNNVSVIMMCIHQLVKTNRETAIMCSKATHRLQLSEFCNHHDPFFLLFVGPAKQRIKLSTI